MTYRAAPISQRDGSSLQNSNCRMASICTGLDFDTLGKKKSTGGKMRSYTKDQAGGTDAGDAKEAWARGYSEALVVRDGEPFDQAVAALKAGRLVHLDVWHAYAFVCLSGSGLYGHTIAVAPEQSGTKWLVADPWCKPAKWSWVEEAALRRGAEAWGRKVFSTGGRDQRMSPERRLEVAQSRVRELMSRFHAGGDEDPDPVPPDITDETSGPQPILFTVTAAHPDGGGGGGGDVRFITATGYDVRSKQKISVPSGTEWFYFDGTRGGAFSKTTEVYALGLTDVTGEFAVQISTGAPYSDGVQRPCLVKVKIKPPLIAKDICPPVEPPAPTDEYVPAPPMFVKKT